MAIVTTYTTSGIIFSNDEWTEEFLTGIAELEEGRGSLMTYKEKQGQWLLFTAGGGTADSVDWGDIANRPALSRTEIYTFAIGTAPALTNGATPDETYANGSTFQSDLLIGARLQIRLNAAGSAPTSGGYTYVPSTGTITTASPVSDANMFILAVFDIAATGSGDTGPTEFSGEFSNEFN